MYSKYRYDCLPTPEAVFQIFTNCRGGKITVNIASFHDFMKARCLMIPFQPAFGGEQDPGTILLYSFCNSFSLSLRSRRPEQCRTIRFPRSIASSMVRMESASSFSPHQVPPATARYPFRYMEFLKLLFRLYVLFA